MTPTEMKQMVEKMKADGTLPDLDKVLDAVHSTRKKYKPQILKARKESTIEKETK